MASQKTTGFLIGILLILWCLAPLSLASPSAAGTAPDLAVRSVNGPASATAGQVITLSGTVQNTGTGSAGFCYAGFYLCSEAAGGEIALGKTLITSIGAGAETTVNMRGNLPGNLQPGKYRIKLVADSTGKVTESNEANNAGYSGTMMEVGGASLADLTIRSLIGPAQAAAGQGFPVTCTVSNTGGGPVSSASVFFYLSPDTTISTSDHYCGKATILSLATGASRTLTVTVSAPSDIPDGTYYAGAIADPANRLTEQNEQNNAGSAASGTLISGSALPDLVVTSLNGPDSAASGESVSVSSILANQGSGDSGFCELYLYLSDDLTISSGDKYLGKVSVSPLDPGKTRSFATRVTIPAGLTRDKYYFGAVADAGSRVVERDETNNIGVDSTPLVIPQYRPPTPAEAAVEQAVLKYTNIQRANAGLGSLTSDTTLAEIARKHSFDMKVRDYFSHENPDGLDPFERMEDAGYTFTCAGENIIYSAKYDLSASSDMVGKHLVDTWMTSTGHRENILRPEFTVLGVGVIYEEEVGVSPYGFIATQDFACR